MSCDDSEVPISGPRAAVVAAVASGGAIGACVRHAVTLIVGSAPHAVLGVNTVGCVLMGVLVVVAARAPLMRAFLGTGVLGGFTTVSTYVLVSHDLIRDDVLAGTLYLLVTPVLAVAGVALGAGLARLVAGGST